MSRQVDKGQGWEERVGRMERELAVIDRGISDLQVQRDAVLRGDREYAVYLDVFEEMEPGYARPVQPRQYYELLGELDALADRFMEPGADVERLMRDHGQRLAHLERVLCA